MQTDRSKGWAYSPADEHEPNQNPSKAAQKEVGARACVGSLLVSVGAQAPTRRALLRPCECAIEPRCVRASVLVARRMAAHVRMHASASACACEHASACAHEHTHLRRHEHAHAHTRSSELCLRLRREPRLRARAARSSRAGATSTAPGHMENNRAALSRREGAQIIFWGEQTWENGARTRRKSAETEQRARKGKHDAKDSDCANNVRYAKARGCAKPEAAVAAVHANMRAYMLFRVDPSASARVRVARA
eukprot:2740920-Pleurochrysis_carterae.AAC.2